MIAIQLIPLLILVVQPLVFAGWNSEVNGNSLTRYYGQLRRQHSNSHDYSNQQVNSDVAGQYLGLQRPVEWDNTGYQSDEVQEQVGQSQGGYGHGGQVNGGHGRGVQEHRYQRAHGANKYIIDSDEVDDSSEDVSSYVHGVSYPSSRRSSSYYPYVPYLMSHIANRGYVGQFHPVVAGYYSGPPVGVYPISPYYNLLRSYVNPRYKRNFLTNIVGSVKDNVKEVIQDVKWSKDVLPITSNQLEQINPEYAAILINSVCNARSGPIAFPRNYVPNLNQVQVSLINSQTNKTVPLKEIGSLASDPSMNSSQNVTIYITGLDIDDIYTVTNLSRAYICRNQPNFLVVHLGQHIKNIGQWLTLDTKTVGNAIAKALVEKLSQYPGSSYHIIGHGVGANVAGQVAHQYRQLTGTPVARVTSLDPIAVCTNQGISSVAPHAGDAVFIDTIQSSNIRLMGIGRGYTHVTFYVHNVANSQQNIAINSNHLAAVHYYTQTVVPGNENLYIGVNPLTSIVNQGNGQGNVQEGVEGGVNQVAGNVQGNVNVQVPMGYGTPANARGNYIVEVNSVYTYHSNPSVTLECNAA